MRAASARKRRSEEEEESVFVSMTDMMVSFLFIVILLLAFFASRYSNEDVVSKVDYDSVVTQRDTALNDILVLQLQISDLQAGLEALRLELQDRDRQIVAKNEEIALLKALLEESRRRNQDPLAAYASKSAEARNQIVARLAETINAEIDAQDIQNLTVSAQGDALRFQGQGLFASNNARLNGPAREIIGLLGGHLQKELPCFTVIPRLLQNPKVLVGYDAEVV